MSYSQKHKEINNLAKNEANEIAQRLVSSCQGQSVMKLRQLTLDYIKRNSLPEELAYHLKFAIDDFILKIKIPAQKN